MRLALTSQRRCCRPVTSHLGQAEGALEAVDGQRSSRTLQDGAPHIMPGLPSRALRWLRPAHVGGGEACAPAGRGHEGSTQHLPCSWQVLTFLLIKRSRDSWCKPMQLQAALCQRCAQHCSHGIYELPAGQQVARVKAV